MPIIDYPFVSIDGRPKPALAIQLINPANGFDHFTWALIDTGADTTVIPEYIAQKLYHDISHKSVKRGYFAGLGGDCEVYYHTFRLNILKSDKKGQIAQETVFRINQRLFAVAPGLHVMVLGVSDFLKKFILTIDYQRKIFSLQRRKKN